MSSHQKSVDQRIFFPKHYFFFSKDDWNVLNTPSFTAQARVFYSFSPCRAQKLHFIKSSFEDTKIQKNLHFFKYESLSAKAERN